MTNYDRYKQYYNIKMLVNFQWENYTHSPVKGIKEANKLKREAKRMKGVQGVFIENAETPKREPKNDKDPNEQFYYKDKEGDTQFDLVGFMETEYQYFRPLFEDK